MTPDDIYEIPPGPCGRSGSPIIPRDKPGHLPPAGGPDPPNRNFTLRTLRFFLKSEFRVTSLIASGQGPLPPYKIWGKSVDQFSKNWGLKILGWGFTPLGGAMPQLTIPCCSPWDLEKNKLGPGQIAPHLGEIWGFKILNFGLHLLETLDRFSISSH